MPDKSVEIANGGKTQKTRERILDAAARIFRRKGYADATMNDIAAAARIRAASIYYHFKSKDEIVEEVLNQGTQRVFEAVRASISALKPEATIRERLETGLRMHLLMLHTQGDYTSANIRLFPEAPKQVIKRHMLIRRSYGCYWMSMLTEAQSDGTVPADCDIPVTQMLLLGALNWSVQWYDPKSHNLEHTAASAATLLLDGLLIQQNTK